MARVSIRFYAELGDFLPAAWRQVSFAHETNPRSSVKDLVENLGVPHTKVDLILVGDESVPFDHHVQEGDRISVFPVFETFDITSVGRLRPTPLRETRFVLDVHLGRLASLLQSLGFDILYRNDCDDAELVRISREQGRILLTRDAGLMKREEVTHAYWVRATEPRLQVREVVDRFHLGRQTRSS